MRQSCGIKGKFGSNNLNINNVDKVVNSIDNYIICNPSPNYKN